MATVASITEKSTRKKERSFGGGKETRTPDPYAASVMLYQLSYAPMASPPRPARIHGVMCDSSGDARVVRSGVEG
jgi:hypothetical protein